MVTWWGVEQGFRGSGDHHVEILEVHGFEHDQLAGVAEAPVRGRDGVDIDVVGIHGRWRLSSLGLDVFAGRQSGDRQGFADVPGHRGDVRLIAGLDDGPRVRAGGRRRSGS